VSPVTETIARTDLDQLCINTIPSDANEVVEAYRYIMQLRHHVTARIAIEQASTFGWERYVGAKGRVIGMTTFGASAPLKELQRKFGFEPARVTALAKELLGRG